MEVIAIDLQPVKPYTAQYVSLGIGQRFDAVVTMNGTVNNYFLRALPMNCQNNNNNGKRNQTAIIRYAGASKTTLPNAVPAVLHDDCLDEPLEKTVPFVAKPVDVTNLKSSLRNQIVASPYKGTSNTEGRVFRWQIGETTQNVHLQYPIL